MSTVEGGTSNEALGWRAVRGALYTFLHYGGSQALRLGANLVVTRLVLPEAYGVMAIVNVLMMGLEMFSDIGIRQSIIRSERGDDPAFLDTMWTAQILRGVGIFAIACLLAVPIASFYDEPLLRLLIPAAGSVAIITSLTPTKMYTLNRNLDLGRVAYQSLVAESIGVVIQIVAAWQWHSVWALMIGSIANNAMRTLTAYLMLPGRSNSFAWEREARHELIGFGRWVFVSTMLTFTSQAMDRLILGKLITMEQLGVYSIGKQMASAPTEAVSHVGSNVVFPYYSRVVTSGQPLPPVFARARFPLLVLSGWGLALLAAGGHHLIHQLYVPAYAEAGWVLQVLALGGWFNMLWSTNVAALLALGKSKWMAATTAVKTVSMMVLVPLGVWLAGFRGAVLAFAATEVVQLAFSSFAVWRNGLASGWHDVPMSSYVLLTAVVGWYVSSELVHVGNIAALAIAAGVVTLTWLPLAWPLLRKLMDRQALFAR